MEPIFKEEDKILIVAPHQDDETFGCGGLMSLYGKICDVVKTLWNTCCTGWEWKNKNRAGNDRCKYG